MRGLFISFLCIAPLTAVAGCGDDKSASESETTAATSEATTTTSTMSTTESTTTTTTSESTTTTSTTTGSGDGEPAKYSESCAPDDGPAVEFSIGIALRECAADFPEDAPILRVLLYRGVNELPVGAYPLDGGNGFASLDTGDGTPETGDVGTVTITSVTADGVVGTYDLTLSEGTELSGSFDAIYCPQDVLCG